MGIGKTHCREPYERKGKIMAINLGELLSSLRGERVSIFCGALLICLVLVI